MLNKVLSTFSYYYSGELTSRLIFDKPKDTDVEICFFEDEMMVVDRSGQYSRNSCFEYTLEDLVEKSKDRLKLEFEGNLHEGSSQKILEDASDQ